DKGAVYHVYDMNRLDRIPRRYTVEAGKSLSDEWGTNETKGLYDLEIYGPNGYFHKIAGNIHNVEPQVKLDYDHRKGEITIRLRHGAVIPLQLEIASNAYGYPKSDVISLAHGKKLTRRIN